MPARMAGRVVGILCWWVGGGEDEVGGELAVNEIEVLEGLLDLGTEVRNRANGLLDRAARLISMLTLMSRRASVDPPTAKGK